MQLTHGMYYHINAQNKKNLKYSYSSNEWDPIITYFYGSFQRRGHQPTKERMVNTWLKHSKVNMES